MPHVESIGEVAPSDERRVTGARIIIYYCCLLNLADSNNIITKMATQKTQQAAWAIAASCICNPSLLRLAMQPAAKKGQLL